VQTLNCSDESPTRCTDSPDAIYAGRGTPDIHQYGKLTPKRWITCVVAVILMHVALIALLWIAGVYESKRLEQDLAITLADAGRQSSVVFIMESTPVLPVEEVAPEVPPEPIAESVPPPVVQTEPPPVQEQATIVMPAQSTVQEPVIETKSPEKPTPQELASKPQVPPPVLKEKPVAKPVQVAPPIKKQPTTEKTNIQKSAADPSSREEPSGSSQNRESVSSEGANTSARAVPKLVKSPKPRYPSESIRLKQEGRVIVNIEVLENGSVGQASIAQSSGFSALDQSALDAVKNWQYTNGSGSGQFVQQWVRASIVFELKNR